MNTTARAHLYPPPRLPATRACVGNVSAKRSGIGQEIGLLDARNVIYFLRFALLGAIFFATFLTAFLGAAFFVLWLDAAFLSELCLTACFGPTVFASVLTGPLWADLTCLGLGFFAGFLRGSTSSFTASGVAGGAGTAGGTVATGATAGVAAGAGAFSLQVPLFPFLSGGQCAASVMEDDIQ
jgi:hypothetical protein